MAQEQTESRYARKRAQRFSAGGRTFKSLGEGQIERVGADKAINPMPRPLDFDYRPKHGPVQKQGFGDFIPMKHEDVKRIMRFKNRDFVYPKPKYKPRPIVVKYDHFAMNYTGYNA